MRTVAILAAICDLSVKLILVRWLYLVAEKVRRLETGEH